MGEKVIEWRISVTVAGGRGVFSHPGSYCKLQGKILALEARSPLDKIQKGPLRTCTSQSHLY